MRSLIFLLAATIATTAIAASLNHISPPGGTKFANDYHLSSAEWDPGVVRFAVDGHQYAEFKTS
jgi:hypothetical protein